MNMENRISTLPTLHKKQFDEYKPSNKLDYLKNNQKHRKIVDSLEEAIQKSGLQNGMTISFHHAFRAGDLIINLVLAKIASMGFKNLTLASSSLIDSHFPIIEHIKNGVIKKIYTSGIRGKLADEISLGIMEEPVNIHSHGGRVHLIKSGEIKIDIAFLGVPVCDEFGNGTGVGFCGSLGYAKVDAEYAKKVILLTQEFAAFPFSPASIAQDTVDFIVRVEQVGDASKISSGATRMTTNPRELLIARKTAEVIFNSGYFNDGFSMQTGTGGAALAVTKFLASKMRSKNITADFALGGITASMVKLHEEGLIKKLLDVQSFDSVAAQSLANNPNHIEISANQYANFSSKGASVDRLDIVILSALEVDINYNVNVITGSDGIIRGASGGHSDTASRAQCAIIVAPLVRGRIPTVVQNVITCITPGSDIDILVTDQGISVNPARPDLIEKLTQANIQLFTIEELHQKAIAITGKPKAIEFTDKPVGIVRYRDGSVIDVIYQILEK